MREKHLSPAFTILLVDDEPAFLSTALFALNRKGYTNVETISDSRAVMPRLAQGGCGVLVLDMTMPYIGGRELLEKVTQEYPEIVTFMITAVNDVQSAVECIKLGAIDYLVKPVQHDQLIAAVRRAVETKNLSVETTALKRHLLDDVVRHPEAFSSILTTNSGMHNLFKYAEAIAGTDVPVLITGETGTGKEQMARAVHTLSERTGKFVGINVAGIDDTVLSDTLFGHLRGAFTGAEQSRNGLIEEAAYGTLFLDEIGDLRPQSQTKLLRLLQERTFLPLGSDTVLSSSARIVFATNRDLKSLMQKSAFRNDLFYRLQAHEIKLPPLRERLDDIPVLARAFIDEACTEFKKPRPYLNPELFPLLSTYTWPGNIRELKGLLFDAVSRNQTDTLKLQYLKEKLKDLRGESPERTTDPSAVVQALEKKVTFSASLPTAKELELMLIQEAFQRTNGNKTQAADLIGVARITVIRRLNELEHGSE
jgi:DNA-binding NtrC family response regulator